MKNRQTGFTQEASEAKVGISVRSGRRIEKGEKTEPKEREWRTRKDPFEDVWDAELMYFLRQLATYVSQKDDHSSIIYWDGQIIR